MSERVPILLDTDLGSDIDDALALAYLLKQPRCELVGITTVSGAVDERAAIAEIVCRAFGREDVPIRTGLSDTLADGPGQPRVPHYAAVKHLPHRQSYPNDAVDFLRKTIRSRPGEIVLLSIGPFSNMAVLLALDPEIPSLLKGFISMAGSFFRGNEAEWNCLCDPEATIATLKRTHRHTLVGLDVTIPCSMPPAEVRAKFAKAPLDVLLLMAEKWFEGADRVTFHDPLAAALIFRPELCELASGRVQGLPGGHTVLKEDAAIPHHVAKHVDVQAFFTEYFRVVEG